MRINTRNIKAPTQTPYAFADGVLHSDPAALANYFAAGMRKPALNHYTRAYEKAQRLQRMAERSRKNRASRGEW